MRTKTALRWHKGAARSRQLRTTRLGHSPRRIVAWFARPFVDIDLLLGSLNEAIRAHAGHTLQRRDTAASVAAAVLRLDVQPTDAVAARLLKLVHATLVER